MIIITGPAFFEICWKSTDVIRLLVLFRPDGEYP